MSLALTEEMSVCCPYCGEYFTAIVDTSVDAQSYTEDCHVCCAPIVFDIYIDNNEELNVSLRQENE